MGSLSYKEGKTTYFDDARKYIEKISHADRPLAECKKTLEAIHNESTARIKRDGTSEDYRVLAQTLNDYRRHPENCPEKEDERTDNDWFFLYLQKITAGRDEIEYAFPTSDGSDLRVKVTPLYPYYNEKEKIVDPKWHLLVSYYIYIDAAFNHQNEKINQEILSRISWKNGNKRVNPLSFGNNVFKAWKEEQGITD